MNERRKLVEGRTDVAAHAFYRDDITALLATKLSVDLAHKTGHRLHILHLTSGIEADFLTDHCNLPSKTEVTRLSLQKSYHNILHLMKQMLMNRVFAYR